MGRRDPQRQRTARTWESLSVLIATLSRPRTRFVVGAPALVAVLGFGLVLWRAPDIDSSNHSDFVGLFGTTAQIVATLFIALALEARALPLALGNARRFVVVFTLAYVALGVAASVLALHPSLPTCLYEPLLALSIGGGAGALISVLVIAYQIVEAEYAELTRAPNDSAVDDANDQPGSSEP